MHLKCCLAYVPSKKIKFKLLLVVVVVAVVIAGNNPVLRSQGEEKVVAFSRGRELSAFGLLKDPWKAFFSPNLREREAELRMRVVWLSGPPSCGSPKSVTVESFGRGGKFPSLTESGVVVGSVI